MRSSPPAFNPRRVAPPPRIGAQGRRNLDQCGLKRVRHRIDEYGGAEPSDAPRPAPRSPAGPAAGGAAARQAGIGSQIRLAGRCSFSQRSAPMT
jgi:hypothetical protein